MKINRSGYYKWLNKKPSQYELNRQLLTEHVKEIHQQHKSYGYHRIAAEIRKNTGWIISDNLVHKCCKFNNIKARIKHYKYKKTGGEHLIFNNVIKNDWKTSCPLQKVVSDMTIISSNGKHYEWTFFLDTFNNSIITWDISSKPGDVKPYFNCRDAYLKLLKKEATTAPVYFHTDQGSVYASKAFNQALLNNNIIRSMSRAGTPTDNPVIESINGWIKGEIYSDFYKEFKQTNDVRNFIKKYVHYYNHERTSYKLKYKSPAQFTSEQGYHVFF